MTRGKIKYHKFWELDRYLLLLLSFIKIFIDHQQNK